MYDSDAAEMKCFDWGDSAGFLLSILNLKHFLRFFFLRLFFFGGENAQISKDVFDFWEWMHLDLADQDT